MSPPWFSGASTWRPRRRAGRDIPSILVESAFISNPEKEAKLRGPDYQAQLVQALAFGIQRYFAKNPPLARSRQL